MTNTPIANEFATLDAQSEVCALATVQTSEVYTEETTPTTRTINYAKLVRHNLRQPLQNRIEATRLQEKLEFAPKRRAIMQTWFTIHTEVEAQRQAIRDRANALDNL